MTKTKNKKSLADEKIKIENQEIDIFDTENLSDLDENFLKSVQKSFVHREFSYHNKILSLFDYKKKINAIEMTIALYRRFGIEKRKYWHTAILKGLIKRNLVRECGAEPSKNSKLFNKTIVKIYERVNHEETSGEIK